MQKWFMSTVVGEDRPGIVAKLTHALYEGGANPGEASIEVQAHDVDGVRQTYTCEGFEARAIQHEVDHLDGILFLDRLVSPRNDLFRRMVYE